MPDDEALKQLEKTVTTENTAYFPIETECVRPQVFHQVNYQLDFDEAYHMVTSCPADYPELSISSKCHVIRDSDDNILDLIPVTYLVTGITYVNKYCLLCNEHDTLDMSLVHAWQPRFVFKRNYYPDSAFYITPQSILPVFKSVISNSGNIQFVPPKSAFTLPCQKFDISSCNQTGLWHIYDEMMEKVCDTGNSLPIIHTVPKNKVMVFKNIACVHCNVPQEKNEIQLSCRFHVLEEYNVFSLSLNIDALDEDKSSREKVETSEFYIDDTVVANLKTPSCLPGYVYKLVRSTSFNPFLPRSHKRDISTKCIPRSNAADRRSRRFIRIYTVCI